MAAGRAAALLLANVALVVVLLNASDDGGGVSAGAGDTTTTSRVTATTVGRTTTTTTTPARAPRDVKVIAANGTTVRGAAARVTTSLKNAGYNALAPLQAKAATASAVYYTPMYEREAAKVAESLGLPTAAAEPLPTPSPVTDLRGANILVIIGPDLAERSTSSTTTRGRSSSSSSTTTTATGSID